MKKGSTCTCTRRCDKKNPVLSCVNDYEYLGAKGRQQWQDWGCTTQFPLIESDGGQGAGVHFDKACMQDEVIVMMFTIY